MASVTLKDLTKEFKEVIAVNKVNLEIRDKEFLVLVGPSGCGKTTALRMIAGLEEATGGEILIGDRVVNDVSPKDRDIAMVFQNYALYPHMSVYENMSFGLRLKRTPTGKPWPINAKRTFTSEEINKRVTEAAHLLDLDTLLQRKPKQLSGGQRQRVALGRAIVREPKVFLMDEPLSNLDAKLRVQTRAELIKLHRRLQITTVYVTHDQVEAMTMGDRIAVMNGGVVQQCDTPLNLYNTPANKFVAGFIGSPAMNFLPVTLTSENGKILAKGDSISVTLDDAHSGKAAAYIGKDVIFGIRPEDLADPKLSAAGAKIDQTINAEVDVVEPLGSHIQMYLKAGSSQIIAMLDSKTELKPGDKSSFGINMSKCHLFDTESELAIF
ncbi:MAG: sn-glycerol-3-phosphate ABC transporter ATP-binding protein UgpC [Chthonomonadales bacterium]